MSYRVSYLQVYILTDSRRCLVCDTSHLSQCLHLFDTHQESLWLPEIIRM